MECCDSGIVTGRAFALSKRETRDRESRVGMGQGPCWIVEVGIAGMRRLLLILILASFPALGAMAQMYKWVDENGKVHYSDTKPRDDAQMREIKGRISSYSSVPKAPSGQAPESSGQADAEPVGPIARNGEVVIFTTQSCGYCRMAKQYMQSHRIAYREMKVDQSQKASRLFQQLGGRGVPLTIIGRDNRQIKVSGFSESQFDRLFKGG